jgi:hypothetical protein
MSPVAVVSPLVAHLVPLHRREPVLGLAVVGHGRAVEGRLDRVPGGRRGRGLPSSSSATASNSKWCHRLLATRTDVRCCCGDVFIPNCATLLDGGSGAPDAEGAGAAA